jgi:hypothetical protein
LIVRHAEIGNDKTWKVWLLKLGSNYCTVSRPLRLHRGLSTSDLMLVRRGRLSGLSPIAQAIVYLLVFLVYMRAMTG